MRHQLFPRHLHQLSGQRRLLRSLKGPQANVNENIRPSFSRRKKRGCAKKSRFYCRSSIH
ncbi:hypothetical protein ANCCAN_24378 [Ancylostoma caninum]|uniref:Uncharacterized protein n=1 Tax=Ancylostoma caninum TaxID=29170 RepID=A0A368FCG3_ANCCA|nr:hypothetical protein ANCCAN_24378 [Ancylostoma caninum]